MYSHQITTRVKLESVKVTKVIKWNRLYVTDSVS